MKRIVVFALVLNAALLGVIAHQLVAIAGGGAVATENGDTNGDGARDISDAVHLLQWLFSGGEPPVAIAQEGGGLSPEQAEMLEHMSIVYLPADDDGNTAKTIRFSGVNVQVVNGTDSTSEVNGLGNLIVGYQELRVDDGQDVTVDTNDRSGSHSLVVGRQNNYSSWGGQVVGSSNTVTGRLSSVCGGEGNTASGDYSVVGGGVSNIADGSGSLVGGGRGNAAMGIDSVVSGGRENRAEGFICTVGGGANNTASSQFGVIGGGERNESSAAHTTIAGGRSNRAIGVQSTVGGGTQNLAAGVASVVGGGGVNTADGFVGVVSGGFGNVARGDDSSVRGGRDNSTSDGEHVP